MSNSRKAEEEARTLSPLGKRTILESDDEKDDESPKPPRAKARQTMLSFSNGKLETKMPLVNPVHRSDPRRTGLAAVASETLTLLPGLLATRPDISTEGYLCEKDKVSRLDQKFCPKMPSVKVKVINSDTIDAALSLRRTPSSAPVCVLNMANAQHAGGGFKHGAMAQEEALCYRSSLYFTLKLRHYPMPDLSAIYSPTVLVFRNNSNNGHTLMDLRVPADLPVIGVISAAAVCQPKLTKNASGDPIYANASDQLLMIRKMRIILRTAIRNKHRKMILAAFGCGVFGNPPEEVARMWKSVLLEPEFAGGWWEEVVFAVLDGGKLHNFTAFQKVLDGLVIQ